MIDLFIENYRADIREDLSALITFAIDDIKDFSSRNTSFSKTIIMPGSARNNALFGNIFDMANSNFYNSSLPNINYNFNAAKSAAAIIFQDNIQVFKGVVRLLEIIIYKGMIEYEVAVFGELGGLIYSMGNKKLEDLDFSEHDLSFSIGNIVSSWDNVPGSGVYFPLIDYGTYSTDKKNWLVNTFRPSLYVKEYLDKMFAASGFTFASSLFNSARFKKLVVPHNQKNLTRNTSNYFTGGTELGNDGFASGPDSYEIHFTSIALGDFTIINSGRTLKYNGTIPITFTPTYNITGEVEQTYAGGVQEAVNIQFQKNGAGVDSYNLRDELFTGVTPFSLNISFASVTLVTNDIIELSIPISIDNGVRFTLTSSSFIFGGSVGLPLPINYGESISVNDAIPRNILQIDFFASLIKLFNLYVYEDKYYPNHLYIEPFIDFYDGNPLNGKDWTQKIDRCQPMRIKPMSEMNSRIYKFNFKDDSDYYNDLYKKRYNISYGSYLYDSEFEFNNDEATADLIFSGTPIVGYSGEAKVYSTIFKRTGTTTLVEETINSNIRILQTKKVTSVPSWNILNGSTVLGSYTYYGYAGHLDDPDAPTNDIQFGVPNELFFVLASGALNVNQFNVYWSPYMAEITDKDSKLLTAYIRLSTKDINLLDFSKLIFIDGSCFRINKITDYNATVEDLCQVELLKVIDTASTTIVPIEDIGDNVLTYIGDGTEGYTVIIPGLLGKNIVLMIQGTNICALAAIPNPGEYNITGTSITFGAPIQEGQLIQILFN